MKAHSANALELAQFLEQHKNVNKVFYSGLESHPQYDLANQQQFAGSGVLSFEVKGGKDAAWKLIDSTRLLSITANLGDAKSTITHPATTTHGRLTDEERQQAGISDGLIRVSVGLESIDDIRADIENGL
jgi:O-succinylhomoserine sulfhydrylase